MHNQIGDSAAQRCETAAEVRALDGASGSKSQCRGRRAHGGERRDFRCDAT